MVEIHSFIKELADYNFSKFEELGHAVAGVNGPYKYQDTAVRNTGHWLIVYAYLWKTTNEKKYRRLAITFADFLVSEQSKSTSGAIACMDGKNFDHLNGLIGQAWTIEALVYAAKTFKNDKYYDCAVNIYRSQKFDKSTKLWKRVELDGTVIDYDFTCNHQVWFAAAGCFILEYKFTQDINSDVNEFVQQFNKKHFRIYKNGLVRHYLNIERPQATISLGSKVKRYIKSVLIPLRKINPNKYDLLAQEKGYHIFELYGYAILVDYLGREIFDSEKLDKALAYGLVIDRLNRMFNIAPILKSTDSNDAMKMNRYAYGYNSPAFEFPYVEFVLKGRSSYDVVLKLLDIQKRLTFNHSTGKLERQTFDGETLTARIYEYIRYCDRKMRIDNNEENKLSKKYDTVVCRNFPE